MQSSHREVSAPRNEACSLERGQQHQRQQQQRQQQRPQQLQTPMPAAPLERPASRDAVGFVTPPISRARMSPNLAEAGPLQMESQSLIFQDCMEDLKHVVNASLWSPPAQVSVTMKQEH